MTRTIAPPQRYPASYYQRDWVLACRDATSFYSTPLAWDLYGPLEPELLTRALAELTERHDALRTAFRARGRDVEQLVWPAVDVPLHTVDLAGTANPVAELENRLVREAERPRLLDRPPLWHVQLLRLRPGHHVLAMFIHHLVFDGWSHGVLHDELVRCLRAAVRGRPPRLPALRLGVGEFAEHERTLRDGNAERWWSDRLAALPPVAPPPLGGRFVSCPLPPVPAASAGPAAAGRRGRRRGQRGTAGHRGRRTAAGGRRRRGHRGHPGRPGRAGVAPGDRPAAGPPAGAGRHLRRDHGRRAVRAGAPGVPGGAAADPAARPHPAGRARGPERDRRPAVRHPVQLHARSASSGEAVLAGGVRIVPRAVDPARQRPRHTEDHPEVLPLSFNLHHQHDGRLTGDVCGHDGVYPGAALAALGEQLVLTLERIAGGGGGRRLPGGAA